MIRELTEPCKEWTPGDKRKMLQQAVSLTDARVCPCGGLAVVVATKDVKPEVGIGLNVSGTVAV